MPNPTWGVRAVRRPFPTGAKYVEALQNTTLCFADPRLRDAVPDAGRFGPKAISGGFASVFGLTAADGRRYAVKCFTREIPDQEERYQAVSAHLGGIPAERLSQPWKMEFDFVRRGVLVDGHWYPVLVMEWVEGTGLLRWIDAHYADSTAVARVARNFLAVAKDLERLGLAHGDLQHGNLLVAGDQTLRLVDYDGMFVPALAGRAATETGLPNYQSPRRGTADFGPSTDRFSAWVIYHALIAVAADPLLWGGMHRDGDESLLLDSRDFAAPDQSRRIADLAAHHDRRVRDLTATLAGHLAADLAQIPPLKAAPARFPPSAGTGTDPGGTDLGIGYGSGIGDGSGLGWDLDPPSGGPDAAGAAHPEWLRARLGARAPAPERSAEPGIVRAPPRVPQGGQAFEVAPFSGRRVRELVAMSALIVGVAVLGATQGSRPHDRMLTAGLAVLALLVFEALWRLRPEHRAGNAVLLLARGRQVRALRASQAALARAERSAAQTAGRLARERDETRAARDAVLRRLNEHERRYLRENGDRLARLRSDKDAELAREQARIRNQYIDAVLSGHLIVGDHRAVGVLSPKLAVRLAEFGIGTAADFTGLREVSHRQAELVSRAGALIRIPGLRPGAARDLVRWRDELAAQVGAAAPRALPGPVESRITGAYLRGQREALAAGRQIAAQAHQQRTTMNAQADAASARIQGEQQRLDTQLAAARRMHAACADRAELFVADPTGAYVQRQELARQVAPLRRRRYLRLLLIGR